MGDAAKLTYYYFMNLPYQFILGAISAILIDLVVLIQIYVYMDKEETVNELTIDKTDSSLKDNLVNLENDSKSDEKSKGEEISLS